MNLFMMFFQFIFSMPITRGSGSGVGDPMRRVLTDDEIHEMIM